jgi:hypothetical protein
MAASRATSSKSATIECNPTSSSLHHNEINEELILFLVVGESTAQEAGATTQP